MPKIFTQDDINDAMALGWEAGLTGQPLKDCLAPMGKELTLKQQWRILHAWNNLTPAQVHSWEVAAKREQRRIDRLRKVC